MEHHERLALLSLKLTVDLPTGNIFKTEFLMAYAFYSVAQVILLGNY
jgi:hypothetical protein